MKNIGLTMHAVKPRIVLRHLYFVPALLKLCQFKFSSCTDCLSVFGWRKEDPERREAIEGIEQ